MIGLQYGTNKGASQAGMTPYGASRQIRLEGKIFMTHPVLILIMIHPVLMHLSSEVDTSNN